VREQSERQISAVEQFSREKSRERGKRVNAAAVAV
jgi:hypothetical protein